MKMRELMEEYGMLFEWEKVSGGWPTNEPTVYKKQTKHGVATTVTKGKKMFISINGKEVPVKGGTFTSLDKALAGITHDLDTESARKTTIGDKKGEWKTIKGIHYFFPDDGSGPIPPIVFDK